MTHAPRASVLMLASALAAGCAGMLESEENRRPGVIAFYDNPIVVQAPDAVEAGAAFEVTVRTYGGGCVTQGPTEVEHDARAVVVRPYDVHSGASVCTDELRMFDHRATVSVEEPGVAEIRVHGTELPADSAVVVTRSVVVE